MMLRVPSSPCTARVVVLAGPSGSGKTRLAARLRLPVLALDDFYPDGSDPLLPHLQAGATGSLIDWDHPDSWDADRALAALRTLCLTGRVDVPVYDISRDGCVGHREFTLGASSYLVAEGIFAAEIVPALRHRGPAGCCCVRPPSQDRGVRPAVGTRPA